MYKIKRNTTLPAMLKTAFTSYEQARSAIRKYLRTRYQDCCNRSNPSITDYGFSVVKV